MYFPPFVWWKIQKLALDLRGRRLVHSLWLGWQIRFGTHHSSLVVRWLEGSWKYEKILMWDHHIFIVSEVKVAKWIHKNQRWNNSEDRHVADGALQIWQTRMILTGVCPNSSPFLIFHRKSFCFCLGSFLKLFVGDCYRIQLCSSHQMHRSFECLDSTVGQVKDSLTPAGPTGPRSVVKELVGQVGGCGLEELQMFLSTAKNNAVEWMW